MGGGHQKRCLEAWSGESGWSGSLQQEFGWLACVQDLLWGVDVCAPGYKNEVLRALHSGWFHAFHMGVECTTWSRACHPAYRNADNLLGFDFKHDLKRQSTLESANLQLEIAIEWFCACLMLGILCRIENPATSMLWLHPKVVSLLAKDHVCIFTVYFCGYGAKVQGCRKIMTNCPALGALENQCCGRTPHSIRLSGSAVVNGAQQAATKMANKYPKRLSTKWAQLVNNNCGVM